MPKRSLTVARLERARQLRIEGRTHLQIVAVLAAEGLGTITQQGISSLLAHHDRKVIEALRIDDSQAKAAQLERLETIFTEAYAAWQASKEHAKLMRETTVAPEPTGPQADGTPTPRGRAGYTETTKELRHRDGEPKYLDVARKALADIRQLLGLNAPIKADVKADVQRPMVIGYQIVPPAGVTLEEVEDAERKLSEMPWINRNGNGTPPPL